MLPWWPGEGAGWWDRCTVRRGAGGPCKQTEKYRQHTGGAHQKLAEIYNTGQRMLGESTPFIGNLGFSFEFIYQRYGSGCTQTRINFNLK